MATLDISGALQSMVNANTPQAMMERHMATAMFSDRVKDVLNDAVKQFEETAVRVRQLETDGVITPEQAQRLIDARQAQLDNAVRFYGL